MTKEQHITQRLLAKRACVFEFAGHKMIADAAGTLYWPAKSCLVVADLHFEKASYLGAFANPIPHYDSRKNLQMLADVLAYYSPEQVICLGDSFHDQQAWSRFGEKEQNELIQLVKAQRTWTWILGNHDPELPAQLPGDKLTELCLDNIVFLHEPDEHLGSDLAQIFGHFHPKMTKTVARQRISGRCFVYDLHKMILPAFGAFTGGLSIEHEAIASLFKPTLTKKLLVNRDKIYPF